MQYPKLFLVFALVISFHTINNANAQIVYLDFKGNNASGSINNVNFSNFSWTIEYAVDTNTANNGSNGFIGAISAGNLLLNDVSYTLSGTSATGNVFLIKNNQNDQVSINPTSGGYVQFLTNTGNIYPALFGNPQNLNSANLGATLNNTTTDSFNNTSYVNYQSSQKVITTTDNISLFASTPPASGQWSISVLNQSTFPAPVPIPGAIWLFGAALASISLFNKHRKTSN